MLDNSNIIITHGGISCRPNIIISDTRQKSGSSLADPAKLLMREEINITAAADAAELLDKAENTAKWQLAIVCDGGIAAPAFDMISRIRSVSDIPVLTLSDECSEIYRIMALSKGADICMDAGSGFAAFEFKARVVSMLRRYLGRPLISPVDARLSADTLKNGALTVDRRRREVISGGVRIRTTAIEYGIIEYLMENCGDVCPIDDIYRRVWKETPYSVRKTVVEHIRRIRCKIEPDPHNPSYIKAVFGIGYKMEKAG